MADVISDWCATQAMSLANHMEIACHLPAMLGARCFAIHGLRAVGDSWFWCGLATLNNLCTVL